MSDSAQTPRISPPDSFDDETLQILERTLTREGRHQNIFLHLAHHPKLLKRVNILGGAFLVHTTLDSRTRELAILRTAARTGCTYEFRQHLQPARGAGLTEREIRSLATQASDSHWSLHDEIFIRAIDRLIESDDLTDNIWVTLREHHTEAQVIELLILVGFYRMLAGFLRAVRVPIDSDLPDLDFDLSLD